MKEKLIFLHGAGMSDKNITAYLQNILEENNIQTYSFNFTGHGGMNLEESSLKNRLQEAENAIKDFKLPEPLNICGSSMGGYIAIKLLEKYTIQNLILFAPAVYTVEAFDVLFNEKFSEIIRQKDSWKYSDAFQIIRSFAGKLLIFIGEKDDVIPEELIHMLEINSVKAKSINIVRIPECPHKIHRWIASDKKWTLEVNNTITQFLLG